MLRIPCPVCGIRDHAEFAYGGDAERLRPAETDDDLEHWHSYVFLRGNPRGPHREYWQHVHGCRTWVCVTRDTASHAIHEAILAREQVARLRLEAGEDGT